MFVAIEAVPPQSCADRQNAKTCAAAMRGKTTKGSDDPAAM
jgi:hypothetical protein